MREIYSTCQFTGGLGNQLFQASHALCQGWRNNIKSIFRPTSFTPLQGNTTEKYVQNIFRNLDFVNDIPNLHVINEKSWDFSPVDPLWFTSIEFRGYFQSSKNFYGFDNKLKEIFSPTSENLSFLIEKYPTLMSPKSLSVHIRLGDYLKNPNIHPVVSVEYIEKALKVIGGYDFVHVFCDDKKWVSDNLKLDNLILINEDDYLEMWAMSLCKNNIISNSTFSWWGSFLNKNESKIIVAPSIWFGESGPQKYKDIYENNWKIINVKNINGKLC